MRIYVAGSMAGRERLRYEIGWLRTFGHEVKATWTEYREGDPYDAVEEAGRDIEEIRWSDTVLVDTIERSSTGGSDWEFGFAFGLGYRQLYIIGPVRSVFHHLARERWDTWEQAFRSGRFGGSGV